MVGLSLRVRGAATGPASTSVRAIFQHRAGQHILGFRMGRHAEARHIDADDADAVDFLGQQLQRHARRGGHAKIGDDHRVVKLGIGHLEDRLADVLEQLAGDQGFGIERHIADGAARAVEMRGEGQAIDAAGRAGQDGRGAAHAQPNPQ